MNHNIHRFESTSDAYNATQTDETIRDGDVLIVESERVVGVLMSAWPVAITPERGAFHTLAPDADLTCIGKHDERVDTYVVHPRKYVVHVNDEPVSEHESPLDAESAARDARGVVRPVDLEPYEHTEIVPADPGTDYTTSVRIARAIAAKRERYAIGDVVVLFGHADGENGPHPSDLEQPQRVATVLEVVTHPANPDYVLRYRVHERGDEIGTTECQWEQPGAIHRLYVPELDDKPVDVTPAGLPPEHVRAYVFPPGTFEGDELESITHAQMLDAFVAAGVDSHELVCAIESEAFDNDGMPIVSYPEGAYARLLPLLARVSS